MPDEACDGRNVALNLTSVHGVLDCPKKNQAITASVLLLAITSHHFAILDNFSRFQNGWSKGKWQMA